jgi:hypothetical protein
MRQPIAHNNKAGGPLGIRSGVWLIVFGLLLLCVLTISLSYHHAYSRSGDIASEAIAGQDSSLPSQTRPRRTADKEITPEVHDGGAAYDIGEPEFAVIEQMVQDRRTWVDGPF